jgi:hypothetical protein
MYNKEFIDYNLDWLLDHPIQEQRCLTGEVVYFVKLPNRSIKTFTQKEFEYFKLRKQSLNASRYR